MQDKDLVNFISYLYLKSCRKAQNINYSFEQHRRQITQQLSKSKFSYKQIKKYIPYTKNDFIADLLQITADMTIATQDYKKKQQKFLIRARMHFGGQHYSNFQRFIHQKRTRKVSKMYQQQQFQWSEQKQNHLLSSVFPNCAFMMGLTKGNGVLASQAHLISCAHVFLQDKSQKIMKIKCFCTPNLGFGVVLIQESGIYKDFDIGFGKIIAYEGPPVLQIPIKVSNKNIFQSFKPITIIQVGLLYIPDECMETFETAQGFIETNQYKNQHDISLNEEMGKLIHNCYGMWGTSGSPLWDRNGNLIGIHNAWNQDSENVSMMVRDDQQNECRAIKQYERRAISIHVIANLYEKWKQHIIFQESTQNYQKLKQIKSQQKSDIRTRKTKIIKKIK